MVYTCTYYLSYFKVQVHATLVVTWSSKIWCLCLCINREERLKYGHLSTCHYKSIRKSMCILSQCWGGVSYFVTVLQETFEIYIIHRPEEALDIQFELIFINGTVHLPQDWNFGIPTTLPSPATPPSPLTATHKAIFSLTWRHTFNICTYKIIATCIEHATALQANNTHVKCQCKSSLVPIPRTPPGEKRSGERSRIS